MALSHDQRRPEYDLRAHRLDDPPDELQGHLDLLYVIEHWLRESIHPAPRVTMRSRFRLLHHLDRVMSTPAHRERPCRPLGVSRASEAHAAHVVPRDVFSAYLYEVNAAIRGPNAAPPLLVDGSDAEMRVKVADGAGIFMMSALRLHQPLLWPMVAHEVAHVDFETCALRDALQDPSAWHAAFARLIFSPAAWNDVSVEEVLYGLATQCCDLTDGEQDPELPDRVEAYAGGLLEIAADFAVFDAHLLGTTLSSDAQVRRFAATFLPNLAMDTAFGTRPLRERGLERGAARQLVFRVAGLLALASAPADGRPLSEEEVRSRIHDLLSNPRDLRYHLLSESLRMPRHVTTVEGPAPSDEPLFDKALRTGVLSELTEIFASSRSSELEDAGRYLATALGLVHGLRGPPSGVSSEGREMVARYLARCLKSVDTGGIVAPKVRPRGGLADDSDVGTAALRELPEFFAEAATLVRRHQSGALRRLLTLDQRSIAQ